MGALPVQHWKQWHRRCALALCSESAQAALRSFAHSRFTTFLRRAGRQPPEGGGLTVDSRTAWHLFESHLQIKTTRAGKCYKQWIFARVATSSDPPEVVVECGATLILRSVVRDFIRAEQHPDHVVSLQTTLSDDLGNPLTLEDLIAGPGDPAEDVAEREYDRLAQRHAREAFATLPRRERVAVASRAMGLSLAHTAVVRAAGCGKTVLSQGYRALVLSLATGLRGHYPDDDAQSVRSLVLLTLHHLKETVLSWARTEEACAFLFDGVDQA